MTDEQRRARALEWLKTIYRDVTDVIVHHHIFWEVQDIIKNNKALENTPSVFFQWMGTSFIASAAAAVRRQADASNDCVSLRRLLDELHAYPHLISRAYFASLHTSSTYPSELIDRTFDKFAGNGMPHLDPIKIKEDIDLLVAKTNGIKHYVDRRIAHYDQRRVAQPLPTFNDLEECLNYVEELVKKYHLLMKAISVSHLLPTFQYDWKEIFRVSWIASEDVSAVS